MESVGIPHAHTRSRDDAMHKIEKLSFLTRSKVIVCRHMHVEFEPLKILLIGNRYIFFWTISETIPY